GATCPRAGAARRGTFGPSTPPAFRTRTTKSVSLSAWEWVKEVAPTSRTEGPSLSSTPDHSALPGACLLAAYPRALATATENRPRAPLTQPQQPVHCS